MFLRVTMVALTGLLAAGAVQAQAPAKPAAAKPAAAAAKPLDSGAALEKANAALNSFSTMSATFSQVGSDGGRATGTVWVQRPGKLRFEYDKPSVLEVVSDGSTVLVRDRKLNTSDPYPISQTPLKFLLSSRIDLGRDTTVRSVSASGGDVNVAIEDSSTLGGTSRITLTFDEGISVLKRWRVVDPQGSTTTVTLGGMQKNVAIDPRTFNFGFMRPVE